MALVIADSEVERIDQAWPSMGEPERQEARAKLSAWKDFKVAEENDERIRSTDSLFTTEDLGGAWDADQQQRYSDIGLAPGPAKARFALSRYFEALTGADPGAVAEGYPGFRARFAKQVFGDPDLSDEALFGKVREKIVARQEQQAAFSSSLQAMSAQAFRDVVEKKPMDWAGAWEGLQKTGGIFDKNFKAMPETWQAGRDVYRKAAFFAVKHRDLAEVIFGSLSGKLGAESKGIEKEAKDLRALAEEMISLPREEREQIYAMAAMVGDSTGDRRYFVEQLGKALRRGFTGPAAAVARGNDTLFYHGIIERLESKEPFLVKSKRIPDKEHPISLSDVPEKASPFTINVDRFLSPEVFGYREATPGEREELEKEARARLSGLQIERELTAFANSKADPIKAIAPGLLGTAEQGLYMAMESAGLMTLAAVNMPAAGGGYAALAFDDLLTQYDGLDPKKAAAMSLTIGVVQAKIDQWQASLALGRLPGVTKLLEDLVNPNATFWRSVALQTGEQLAQESVQNIMPAITQKVFAAFDSDIPDLDLRKEIGEQWRKTPEVFFAILPLSLMGAGALTVRESRWVGYTIRDERSLEALNIKRFREIPKMEASEGAAAFREDWNARTPAEINDANQKIASIVEAQERLKANPEAAGSISANRDGSFQVVDYFTGKSRNVATEEEAAIAIKDLEEAKAQRRDRGLSVMIRFLEDRKPGSEREIVEGQTLKDVLAAAPEDKRGALLPHLIARMEYQRDEMLASGAKNVPGATEADLGLWEVLGQNVELTRDGVWRTASKISRGANWATVVEEETHGHVTEALRSGKVTMPTLQKWLKSVGEKHESEVEVIEGMGKLGVAYMSHRLREEGLLPGLKAYLRAAKEVFVSAFRLGAKMILMKREGSLDSELEAFLSEAVGLTEAREVERASGEVLSDISPDLVPFSIAPSLASIDKGLNEIAEKHSANVDARAYAMTTYGKTVIKLDNIQAKRSAPAGSGTAYMEDLTRYADEVGLMIVLQTASKGDLGSRDYKKTSSEGRLKSFYSRHGFRSNYSKRHYRPDLPGNMNRPPGSGSSAYSIAPKTPQEAFSVSRVEEMLQRAWNANLKDYYDAKDPNDPKNWREWVEKFDAYDIALVLDSDSEIYHRYLAGLGDHFVAEDVIEAYKAGTLPRTVEKPAVEKIRISLRPVSFEQMGVPWEPSRESIPTERLLKLWQIANTRATKKTRPAVESARRSLFFAYHSSDLVGALGIDRKVINKALRSWSNYPASAKDFLERVNAGKPEVSIWTGIANASYLSKANVKPSEIDSFVKSIDASNRASWNSPTGEMLRSYIVRAFLAIDTRISYADLSFKIGSLKERKFAGLYESSKRLITIDSGHDNTVAHEIGHYLDHKWAIELGIDTQLLSDASIGWEVAEGKTSKDRVLWAQKFQAFVNEISERSDIASEYHQRRREVFARFVDRFVRWVDKEAGVRHFNEGSMRADRFRDSDFRDFVELLQEKAFVDAADGNPLGASLPDPSMPGESIESGAFSIRPLGFEAAIEARIDEISRDPIERLRILEAMKGRLRSVVDSMRWTKSPQRRGMAEIETDRRTLEQSIFEQKILAEPEIMGALENGEAMRDVRNNPLVSALLDDIGRLVSRSEMMRRDRGRASQNVQEYYDAPYLPSYFYGGTVTPDEAATRLHELGLLRDPHPSSLWAALESAWNDSKRWKVRYAEANRFAKQARAEARAESEAWAKRERAAQPMAKREEMLQAMGILDAIQSSLPREYRAMVGGYAYKRIAELQDPAARLKFILEQLERVDRSLELALRKEYRERIEKLLKDTRPKEGDSKQKRSTLGVEAQEIADKAFAASLLDDKDTAARLEALEKVLSDQGLSPEELMRATEDWGIVNAFGDLPHRTADELAEAWNYLRDVATRGRAGWRVLEEERLNAAKELRAKIIESLGRGSTGGLSARKEKDKSVLSKLDAFATNHYSFKQILGDIFGASHEITKRFSKLIRKRTGDYESAMIGAQTRFREATSRALGVNPRTVAGRLAIDRELERMRRPLETAVKFRKWQSFETVKVPIDVATQIVDGSATGHTFTLREIDTLRAELAALPADTRKETVSIERVTNPGELEFVTMSRLEALQYLLSWDQPDVREKMERQGISESSINQMRAITADHFSQSLLAFLRDEYSAGYARMNPVYRRLFGMNMPQVENYAPTRYRTGREKEDDLTLFGAAPNESGMSNGFTKSRVSHNAPMRQSDALVVFWQHTIQANYWISFAEAVREIRSVVANPEVSMSVEQSRGAAKAKQLREWVDSLATGGKTKSSGMEMIDRLMRRALSGQSIAALGFRLKTVMMQADASLRFMPRVPVSHQLKSLRALVTGRLNRRITDAWRSETIQRRLAAGFAPEVRLVMSRSNVKPSALLSLAESSMVPIQYMDAALTTFGAAVVFDYHYKEALRSGQPEAEAEAIAADAMDEVVFDLAQPASLANRSLPETSGNGLVKAFMLFRSDPRLKMAHEYEAWKSLAGRGSKGDKRQALKMILSMRFYPLLGQFLADFYKDVFTGEDDDEIWKIGNYVRALTLGHINGLFILGDALEGLAEIGFGKRFFNRSLNPLSQAASDIAGLKVEDILDVQNPDEMVRAWKKATGALAIAGGTFAAPAVMVNILQDVVGFAENLNEPEE